MRKEITLHQYYKMRNQEFNNRVKKGIFSDKIKISKYDKDFMKFDRDYFMEITGINGKFKAKFNFPYHYNHLK